MTIGVRSRGVATRDCTIDVSHTPHALHAHVSIDDFEARPGDRVIVLDAPCAVLPGDRHMVRGKAIIQRASLMRRIWTRASGYFALSELCEVGFAPRRK